MDFCQKRYIRHAKTSYTCKYCRGVIAEGNPYVRQAGVSRRKFYAFNLCVACNTLADYYLDLTNDPDFDSFELTDLALDLCKLHCDYNDTCGIQNPLGCPKMKIIAGKLYSDNPKGE